MGLGWYDYGFRFYDPVLARFPQLDPLANDFVYLTPYQYASNNPVTNIDLDGLEGVRSTEYGSDGKVIRHTVELNIRVVTVAPWDKSNGKQPQGRVQSSFTSEDVAYISSELNNVFNGPENKGSKNSAGETVFFKFNVSELNIDKDNGATESDLKNLGVENGIVSGAVDFPGGNNTIAPENMMLEQPLLGNEGTNDGVITKVDPKRISGTVPHETGHQLLMRSNEKDHALGGIMSNPPGSLNTRNVDAILKDALPR